MENETIAVGIISFMVAAILSLAGSYLFGQRNTRKGWRWIFPGIGAISFVILLIFQFDQIFIQGKEEQLIIINWLLVFAFVSIITFAITSYLILFPKTSFRPAQLNKRINKFTVNIEKEGLCLIGGDFDFLGGVTTMDSHEQYQTLKDGEFTGIKILCKKPNPTDESTRAPYGKFLKDFNADIRFYTQGCAKDIKIRGRRREDFLGRFHLLLFQKIESKRYELIETNRNDSQFKHYEEIWKLLWKNAEKMNDDDKKTCKDLLTEKQKNSNNDSIESKKKGFFNSLFK